MTTETIRPTKILIADSGSTKTEWAGLHCPGLTTTITAGINPVFHTPGEIRQRVDEVSNALGTDFDQIYFYGAGCIDDERCGRVREVLHSVMPWARIEIETDLVGAARALCGNQAGVACILGTGSNSCYYDGQQITHNVRPLGFILGDEGSGAHIGRSVLSSCLKGLMPSELAEAMHAYCGLSYSEIIDRVYRQPSPNRFLASFALFARDNLHRAEVEHIVVNCFEEFAHRCLSQYDIAEGEKVNFVGSVAYGFEQQLRKAMANCGFEVGQIVQQPIRKMVDYHLHNL